MGEREGERQPRRLSLETVTYVGNIYKYYLAYQMMTRAREAREKARPKPST